MRCRTSREQFVDCPGREAKSDRTNSAAKTNDAGPKQSQLEIGRLRFLLEPHPKLQPPKRKEDQTFRFSAVIWHAYSSLCAQEKIKLRNREDGRSEKVPLSLTRRGTQRCMVEKLLRLTGCIFQP